MLWVRKDDGVAIMPWNLRHQPIEKFNPLQPRDEVGRWTEGGGGGSLGAVSDGSFAVGGNRLGIEEVMGLHKSSDPLQDSVYRAEESVRPPEPETPAPSAPKRNDFASYDEYDAAYKNYSKKWMAWAVEAQADIVSENGQKFLNGNPAGVKKYVQDLIRQDWFVQRFGDGSSLPSLDVKVSNADTAGRHILARTKSRATGEITDTRHEISLSRQFTKNEALILHEVSHYATGISQTAPFESHGVEFARNHVFVVENVAGSARAQALASAYVENGVDIGK